MISIDNTDKSTTDKPTSTGIILCHTHSTDLSCSVIRFYRDLKGGPDFGFYFTNFITEICEPCDTCKFRFQCKTGNIKWYPWYTKGDKLSVCLSEAVLNKIKNKDFEGDVKLTQKTYFFVG